MTGKLRVFYYNTFLPKKLGEGMVSRHFWAEAMKLDGWQLVTVPSFSLEERPSSSVNGHKTQNGSQRGRSPLKKMIPESIRQTIRSLRSPTSRIPVAPYLYTRQKTRLIQQVIREQGPFNVYLLHLSQSNLETLAHLCRSLNHPVVLRAPGPLAYQADHVFNRYMSRRARHCEQYLYQRADAIAVISTDMKQMIADYGVAPEKIFVLPNGIDFSLFASGQVDGTAVRERYGLRDRKVVGYVGGFWHGNDMNTLLHAWRLVENEDPQASLLLVGNGSTRQEAQALAEKLSLQHCIWVGHVPHQEVPTYIAAMDVGVGPYISEAAAFVSPLKVIEYTAMGLPVVATKGGQISELVQHGQTGLLYPAGDPAQLAVSLLDLLHHPEKASAMSRCAVERMQAWYGWHEMAEQMLALCRSVVN